MRISGSLISRATTILEKTSQQKFKRIEWRKWTEEEKILSSDVFGGKIFLSTIFARWKNVFLFSFKRFHAAPRDESCKTAQNIVWTHAPFVEDILTRWLRQWKVVWSAFMKNSWIGWKDLVRKNGPSRIWESENSILRCSVIGAHPKLELCLPSSPFNSLWRSLSPSIQTTFGVWGWNLWICQLPDKFPRKSNEAYSRGQISRNAETEGIRW